MPVLKRFIAFAAIVLLAAQARADDSGEAKKHFERGQLHYTLGEFAEAASEFKEAFRLKHEPAILFNVAQAMRQSFQYRQAFFYYSQYLHLRPEAANRSEVEGLMAQMKQKLDEEPAPAARPAAPEAKLAEPIPEARPTAAPAKPAPRAAVVPGVEAAPAPAQHGMRIPGYVLLGTGVAAEGLAFAFHSGAKSAADQFNRKYSDRTLTASDSQLKSDAQSKGTLATVAAVGGALLLATGAAFVFVF
jgi:tetratricopeptide (TPR) repeat protein